MVQEYRLRRCQHRIHIASSAMQHLAITVRYHHQHFVSMEGLGPADVNSGRHCAPNKTCNVRKIYADKMMNYFTP